MADSVFVMVGTRKGAFVLDGGAERARWSVRGPYLEGQNIMDMAFDPRTNTVFAAVGDPWFGSRIYRSTDSGRTWDEPTTGPTFPPDSGLALQKVWNVTPGRESEPGVVYAGVEPAALFKSSDGGDSWHFVKSLNDHPTRDRWQPGAGGLCLHTIVLDPFDSNRLHVGISAAGMFSTDDGGKTWRTANDGTRVNFLPDQEPEYAEFGQCVHKIEIAKSTNGRMYQQNHCGVYRTDDGGANWIEITKGLPSDFGFCIGVHPTDADTAWVCPVISGYKHWVPDGAMTVYRTRDAGRSWQKLANGLPQSGAFVNILRDGMAVDSLEPAGVYIGTNTGQLYVTADEGDSWQQVPGMFPPINSVGVAVIPG